MKRFSSLHPAVRETALYGMATLVSQVVSAFRGLVIASMLGPASYGLWKSVQVVLDWLGYTHFGVMHGMARQIPLSRKVRDEEGESAARAVGLRAGLITGLLAGGVLVLFTMRRGSIPWGIWVGIAGLLVVSQLFRYIHMVCLADGRFGILSGANLLLATVSLIAMFALVPRMGIHGVLLGLGLGYLAALAMGFFLSVFGHGKSGSPLWGMAKHLAYTGFPFMAVDGLFVFWQRLDRMVLIPYYGAESAALGYYGLATMVASFAIQIPQVFTRVLFRRTVPIFQKNSGDATQYRAAHLKHLEAPCLLVSFLSPWMLSVGVLCSWWMIVRFLPEYSSIHSGGGGGCEESVAWLMFACHGCGIGLSFRNIYTGMNRQWRLAGIYALCSVVTMLPPLLLLSHATPVDPVGVRSAAWGMAIASTLYGILALIDCSRLCASSAREILSFLFRSTWPLVVYAGWTLWVLRFVMEKESSNLTPSEWAILFSSSLLLFSPIAVVGTWRVWVKLRIDGIGLGSTEDEIPK